MDRRKFLQGAAALFAAPAIVKADSLMKIWVPPKPEFVTFRRPNPYYVTEFGRIDDVRLVETPEIELIEPYGVEYDLEGRSINELYHAIDTGNLKEVPSDTPVSQEPQSYITIRRPYKYVIG